MTDGRTKGSHFALHPMSGLASNVPFDVVVGVSLCKWLSLNTHMS